MGLMACNALDYLVAVAMELDIDAREDGVYLKDGTRWQPTVNWAQVGPIINKLRLNFSQVADRYQPIMAKEGAGAGTLGETHQVAVCNYVYMFSKGVDHRTEVPYERITADALHLRDERFVKKYPYLEIDDIERVEKINKIGVAEYLKESAERHSRWRAALPESVKAFSIDRAPGLIDTIVTHYPELISVEAHAMGIKE